MSFLGLRFRSTSARLQILDYQHPELTLENVSALIATHLTNRWEEAKQRRLDLDNPYTIWEILYLDAVICLEDWQGKFTRVGVSLQAKEERAYRVLQQARKPALVKVHKSLKIYRYWMFCLDWEHFPDDGEWVDLLYREIDKPNHNESYQLINL